MSDYLARFAASGARSLDPDTRLIELGEHETCGCRGCNVCHETSGHCVLPEDAADTFFATLAGARSAIFVAPIYFYALPGQFKLFIDRSQRYWGALLTEPERPALARQAGVILVAGRSKGKKIFAGAMLTLKWFLIPFGYRIVARELFAGLEKCADILPEQEELAWRLGRQLACA